MVGSDYFCMFLCHLVILNRSLMRENLNAIITVKKVSVSPKNFRVFLLLRYWKSLFMNNKQFQRL